MPRLPLKPGAKRWWDKAVLNPLKTAAQGSRRVYQRRRDESSRQVYLEASLAYRRGIHEAKQRHWREFLESLTPSTLFTASKYATGAFSNPALTVPPLRSHTGELTDAPEVQAELLFQGTSAPTVPCDLSDLLPPIDAAPPPPPSYSPTTTSSRSSRHCGRARPQAGTRLQTRHCRREVKLSVMRSVV